MKRTKTAVGIALLASVLLAMVVGGSLAQEPGWEKTFGGSAADRADSVQQTRDGGFIIVGATESFGAGNSDVYLIKTDAAGNELWSTTFGGSDFDDGWAVRQTADGGYIISGSTESSGAGDSDAYLIKTDDQGHELWSRTFGGSRFDEGDSVQQTSDGGYIIAGTTNSFGAGWYDVYLVKTDAQGHEQWSRTFGSRAADWGGSVQQTSDGGYVIAGSKGALSMNLLDVHLIKTDALGNELWSRTFGGSRLDEGYAVQQTTDDGYVIVGRTRSFGAGNYDIYLIKTDSEGHEVWSRTFGGPRFDAAYSDSVQQTADGGYVIAGHRQFLGSGGSDVILIKTDAEGRELWSKTFGGRKYDGGSSVQETAEGGYVIAGYTDSFGAGDGDVYLITYKHEENAKEE